MTLWNWLTLAVCLFTLLLTVFLHWYLPRRSVHEYPGLVRQVDALEDHMINEFARLGNAQSNLYRLVVDIDDRFAGPGMRRARLLADVSESRRREGY